MIIFAADLHLTPRIWTNRWSIKGDAYHALRSLSKYIDDNFTELEAVVLGGDTTDVNTPDVQSLHELSIFVKHAAEKGVPVYFINGQHDRGTDGLSLLSLFGAVDISDELVTIGDISFYGMSYRSGQELKKDLASCPECDYLVLHTAFKHLLGFEGAWQVEADDIPEYIPNVLVGDIHVHDVSQFGNTKIYSPGSGYACNAGEIDKGHGFFLLNKEGVQDWKPYDTRQFHKLTMTSENRDDIMGQIMEIDKGASKVKLAPVVFVKKASDLEISFDKIKDAIIIVLDEALSLVDTSELELEEIKDTEMASFLSLFISEEDTDTYAFAEGLLEAQDPRDYTAEWLQNREVKFLDK